MRTYLLGLFMKTLIQCKAVNLPQITKEYTLRKFQPTFIIEGRKEQIKA